MLSTTAIFEEHLQYCNFCRAVLTLPIAISVSVFFLTITIGHVLKNRDPSFSYLLDPYHTRVSERSATLVPHHSNVCVTIFVGHGLYRVAHKTKLSYFIHILSNNIIDRFS